jgi:NAD(P)-dependent dehydrogenase (short-subunit alcohol dehydrogenase family)
MNKTILITGCSSGFGKAAARLFIAKGWNVIATMRAPDQETELTNSTNLLLARLDVQDAASIHNAVETGIERFGQIDALINNAGFSLAGVFESIPREKILEQFEVNVFGVMEVTRALLPHFRWNRSGLILNVSSRAGLVGLPMLTLYCAAKYALEGFSESLAYELASQNIIVKLVEPSGGVSSTDFGQRMGAERTQINAPADYDRFIARTNAAYAGMGAKRMATATEVAQVLHEAATDVTNRLRYFTGEDTGGLAQARRELSEADFREFMRARFPLEAP